MDAITYPNSGSPRNTPADVLTAHLTGDNMCRMGGIYPRQGSAPVLALCRELIAAGYDPSAQLQVYRGSTLCLLVRSVGEAAGLRVNGAGTGFIPLCEPTAAPPISANGNFDAQLGDGGAHG